MTIQPYRRLAHYYETDQMGIVHHSNYIRWFEEARVDLMDQIGYGYVSMEQAGIQSPVLQISCQYKSMVRFGDRIRVIARVKSFTGVRLEVDYRIEDEKTGELRVTGASGHCFIRGDTGRPVSLKKTNPEIYRRFLEASESKAT